MEFQPRLSEVKKTAMIVLGSLAVGLCFASVYFVSRPEKPTPVNPEGLVPLQTVELPTMTFPFIQTATPTFESQATATLAMTTTISQTGEACIYSAAEINAVLPPLPNGQRSPYENYLCNNGKWYAGRGDVINGRTGDWGQDGTPEDIFLQYGPAGNIVSRIFVNPQGTQIPGPQH